MDFSVDDFDRFSSSLARDDARFSFCFADVLSGLPLLGLSDDFFVDGPLGRVDDFLLIGSRGALVAGVSRFSDLFNEVALAFVAAAVAVGVASVVVVDVAAFASVVVTDVAAFALVDVAVVSTLLVDGKFAALAVAAELFVSASRIS